MTATTKPLEPLKGQTKNKGEWSELYVFLKLLGEGKLYAADAKLNKNLASYLEVVNIIREEIKGEIITYSLDASTATITISNGSNTMATVCAQDFIDNAEKLYNQMRKVKSQKGSLSAPDDVCDFAETISVRKASAPAARKTDILLTLRDASTALISKMGFSIKSQLAQKSTLYNAGSGSQFIYEVVGMNSDNEMEEFNAYWHYETEKDGSIKTNKDGSPKIKREWESCINMIARNNYEIVFCDTARQTTRTSLMMVRDSMPELLAWIFRRSLIEDRKCKEWPDLLECLKTENPLNYPNVSLYEKAIKDFLFATFSGMTGTNEWDGKEEINGGYIVVKADGEVLCYHSHDREVFKQYLFDQTFVEYVSTSHYPWSYIQKTVDGSYVIPMHASVRFFDKFKER